jgi:hypothetical protein
VTSNAALDRGRIPDTKCLGKVVHHLSTATDGQYEAEREWR